MIGNAMKVLIIGSKTDQEKTEGLVKEALALEELGELCEIVKPPNPNAAIEEFVTVGGYTLVIINKLDGNGKKDEIDVALLFRLANKKAPIFIVTDDNVDEFKKKVAKKGLGVIGVVEIEKASISGVELFNKTIYTTSHRRKDSPERDRFKKRILTHMDDTSLSSLWSLNPPGSEDMNKHGSERRWYVKPRPPRLRTQPI